MQYLVDPEVERDVVANDNGDFICPSEHCNVQTRRKSTLLKHIAQEHPDIGGYFQVRLHREAFTNMLGGFVAWSNTGKPGGLPKKFLEGIEDAKVKVETFIWALLLQKVARIAQLETQLKDIDAVLSKRLTLDRLDQMQDGTLSSLQKHVQEQIDIELKQVQAHRKSNDVNPTVLAKQILELFTTSGRGGNLEIDKLAGIPNNPQHRAQLLKVFSGLLAQTQAQINTIDAEVVPANGSATD